MWRQRIGTKQTVRQRTGPYHLAAQHDIRQRFRSGGQEPATDFQGTEEERTVAGQRVQRETTCEASEVHRDNQHIANLTDDRGHPRHLSDDQGCIDDGVHVPHGVVLGDLYTSIESIEPILDNIHGYTDGRSDGGRFRHSGGGDYVDDKSFRINETPPVHRILPAIIEHISGQPERFLVVEIYVPEVLQDDRTFLSDLQSQQRARAIPIKYRDQQFHSVSVHFPDDVARRHYHCLHTCTWANSTCRCGRLENRRQFVLRYRRALPIQRLVYKDIENIIVYHMGRPRQPLHCEVGREFWRLDREDGVILEGDSGRPASPGMVEVCDTPLPGDARQQPISGATTSGLHISIGGQLGQQGEWRSQSTRCDGGPSTAGDQLPETTSHKGPLTAAAWESLINRTNNRSYRVEWFDLVSVMKRYLNTPMNALPYSIDWFEIPSLTRINHSGLLFDNALRAYRAEINSLTVTKLFEYQTSDGALPVYSAGSSCNVDDMYWGIIHSIYMIFDLLHFQFNGSFDDVKNFLNENYNVFERQSGKKNAMIVIGPASSGKNFWFDGVADFSLNPGKMENPCRSNQFAFSACHNRRCIKWDECYYDRYFDNDVLNLLQGKTFLANIKYRNPEPVHRTPIFIMSNVDPFTSEQRFKDRLHRYEWRRCERLARFRQRQPYPLAHGILLLYGAGLLDNSSCNKVECIWNKIKTRYDNQ